MISLPIINDVRRALIERTRLTLGYLLFEMGNYEESAKYLASISPEDENYEDSLLGLGWAYIKAEKYREAIFSLEKLLQRFPQTEHQVEAYFLLGQSYLKLGLYDGALFYFTELLKMFPKGNEIEAIGREIKAKIKVEEKRIEEARVSLLMMESQLLTYLTSRIKGVPNYLKKDVEELEKKKEKLLQDIMRERSYFEKLYADLNRLKRIVRKRELDWRSYAEYGIARALFLKGKELR